MIANPIDKNKSGVYCVKNKITGQVYIGQAKDIYKRIQYHRGCFENQRFKSMNKRLYEGYYIHGFENFEYFVLEYTEGYELKSLLLRECYWIEHYNSTDLQFGYNLRKDTAEKMVAHETTRAKISETIKQQWKDGLRDDHSEKLTANWKDNEARRKLQSEVMSKTISKYLYIIRKDDNTIIECGYKKLIELGYKNAISAFYTKDPNIIRAKDATIERILLKKLK